MFNEHMRSNTNDQTEFGLADGLSPAAWPGENYALVDTIPGFVTPLSAIQALNNLSCFKEWEQTDKDNRNVEHIYTLKHKGLPLEIRARLAGQGVHADVETIQYVVEFKYLRGTAVDGVYGSKELFRGDLDAVGQHVSRLVPLIEAQAFSFCPNKNDHVIVSDEEVIKKITEQLFDY